MSVKEGNSLSRLKIDRTALAKRRREAMKLYQRGLTQYRIAKKMGVSFEAVSNWVETYKKDGIEGLERIGRPGPKSLFKEKNKPLRKVIVQEKANPLLLGKAVASKSNVLGRLFKLIGNQQN